MTNLIIGDGVSRLKEKPSLQKQVIDIHLNKCPIDETNAIINLVSNAVLDEASKAIAKLPFNIDKFDAMAEIEQLKDKYK